MPADDTVTCLGGYLCLRRGCSVVPSSFVFVPAFLSYLAPLCTKPSQSFSHTPRFCSQQHHPTMVLLPVEREQTVDAQSMSSSPTTNTTPLSHTPPGSTRSSSLPPLLQNDSLQATMDGHANKEALRALGGRTSRLNEVMRKLEQLSINTTLSSLPKYAMVGDQSAGKSSIVRALCGIPLPRSDGTTTRCPFYITTTNSTPPTGSWICHVSVELKFDYDDSNGTWNAKEKSNVEAFATVQTPNELETALRRAQVALLNPKDGLRITSKSTPPNTRRKFASLRTWSPWIIKHPAFPSLRSMTCLVASAFTTCQSLMTIRRSSASKVRRT